MPVITSNPVPHKKEKTLDEILKYIEGKDFNGSDIDIPPQGSVNLTKTKKKKKSKKKVLYNTCNVHVHVSALYTCALCVVMLHVLLFVVHVHVHFSFEKLPSYPTKHADFVLQCIALVQLNVHTNRGHIQIEVSHICVAIRSLRTIL